MKTQQIDVGALLKEALKKEGMTVHEKCDMFPMLSANELIEMAQDIKAHGLREPITAKGKQIWDGRNRLVACAIAKVKPRFVEPPEGVTAEEFIISANIMRRHLTTEQRTVLAVEVLRANPTKSDRAVAKQVKLSAPKVGKIRKQVEGRENNLHVDKRTDSKGRQQPAHKPKPKKDNGIGAAINAATNGLVASTGKPPTKPIANIKNELLPPVQTDEISTDEHRAKMAALDTADQIREEKREEKDVVAEFKKAVTFWLDLMNDDQKKQARDFLF